MPPDQRMYAFPIHAVKCLHCGHVNDCRGVYNDYLAMHDFETESQIKEQAYATGRRVRVDGQPVIQCDRCQRGMSIVKVDKSPRLVVRAK